MPQPERWTGSMLQAWNYAQSALEHGMSATAGLQDYRAGGGAIRTTDWYDLSGLAREAQATGDAVIGQPWATPIPGQAYTQVDLDYGQRYVTIADIRYVDASTGEVVHRTITVESDSLRTWDEIEDDLTEAAERYGVVGGAAAVTIIRVRFYSPRWLPE